jgi:hypothetical protein
MPFHGCPPLLPFVFVRLFRCFSSPSVSSAAFRLHPSLPWLFVFVRVFQGFSWLSDSSAAFHSPSVPFLSFFPPPARVPETGALPDPVPEGIRPATFIPDFDPRFHKKYHYCVNKSYLHTNHTHHVIANRIYEYYFLTYNTGFICQ